MKLSWYCRIYEHNQNRNVFQSLIKSTQEEYLVVCVGWKREFFLLFASHDDVFFLSSFILSYEEKNSNFYGLSVITLLWISLPSSYTRHINISFFLIYTLTFHIQTNLSVKTTSTARKTWTTFSFTYFFCLWITVYLRWKPIKGSFGYWNH